MDSSKNNIVFVDTDKNIVDMTREELRAQVARPLAQELISQRDAAADKRKPARR